MLKRHCARPPGSSDDPGEEHRRSWMRRQAEPPMPPDSSYIVRMTGSRRGVAERGPAGCIDASKSADRNSIVHYWSVSVSRATDFDRECKPWSGKETTTSFLSVDVGGSHRHRCVLGGLGQQDADRGFPISPRRTVRSARRDDSFDACGRSFGSVDGDRSDDDRCAARASGRGYLGRPRVLPDSSLARAVPPAWTAVGSWNRGSSRTSTPH